MSAADQTAAMLAQGLLPFDAQTQHIAIGADHPAIAAPLTAITVDWVAGTVSVVPTSPEPQSVPQSVTRRQLYRGLMQVGWLGTTMPQIDAAITAMIGAMPEPPREVARVEFFTSRDFLRNNPLLVSALMSPPLSKTSAEVDEFFRLCASFAPEGE
jgi:hypothetical protein